MLYRKIGNLIESQVKSRTEKVLLVETAGKNLLKLYLNDVEILTGIF